ncbi:Bystin [Thalictrum thalictroides]|uniref:Bystin n=1 Tax=Thalictrum thalictroides TaxID=46969 RepID=A0A7J6V3F1_THATH|nr:Bystin [Thalictrum thalictroides]
MAGKRRRDDLRSCVPKRRQEEHKLTRCINSKVLKEALIQQKEIEEEEKNAILNANYNPIYTSSEDDDDELETQREYIQDFYNDKEVNEEEERILDAFMSKSNLGDIVLSKIREKDQEVSSEAQNHPKMDHSVIDIYKGVGEFLSKYTMGKLPKAFKHIPSLKCWEDVLWLTEPGRWSANAVYQATRIFASNFSPEKVQRFYTLVLLPRIREDIRKNKRLHFSLFQALKKSLYKPKAFNKGILLPLCKSGTCTLREAVIIGSVIGRVSIPSHHSGAALLKLAEMEYCGTTSYFIKLLVDKKYCLAYRVLDGLIAHFMRFLDDTRVMPVIWHQSLLSFVQRYKHELTKEDKDNLERLVHVHRHHLVTLEIQRELNNSRNRGQREDPLSADYSAIAIIEDRYDFPDVPMEKD